MPLRRPHFGVSIAVLVLAAAPLQAASFRTQNFIVNAPTPQVAQQFGQMAEQYRKQKAIEWLGQEMPAWPRPCPLEVVPKLGGAGGATQFNYDFRGGYDIMKMEISGEMERMLHSVLPHEITHTIFAHYFRYPVPRWADEGGSVLSEDDRERGMHDRMCRDLLNQGHAIPLRRLFQVKEYQEVSNVMIIYAQGFSISNYLVTRGGRQAFLGFVAAGMRGNWDQAVQTYFHMQSVEALEEAWLAHLRATKNGGSVEIAQNTSSRDSSGRLVTRQTVPPAQPLLEGSPTARGQSDDDQRWGTMTSSRPSQLPDRLPAPPAILKPLTVPPPASRSQSMSPLPPPVRLGLPEFGPASPVAPRSSGSSAGVGQGN
jgi:hypothetical protein